MKNILNVVSVSVFAIILIITLSVPTTMAAGPSKINLGDAGDFVILTKTGISTTGSTSIDGNIGVSPAAATYLTGFSLDLVVGSAFATSPIVDGKIYAPGYADPTPADLTSAINDMETAYTDGKGRSNPTATELGSGNIGGLTIAPGLYKWGTGVTIPSDVTLSGSSGDVWIFQIAQDLDISSGKEVVLSGGAKADNVYWVVSGQVTLGTNSDFNGNILSKTAIVLNTGASLDGRALAQTAVTLDANSVTKASTASASSSNDEEEEEDEDASDEEDEEENGNDDEEDEEDEEESNNTPTTNTPSTNSNSSNNSNSSSTTQKLQYNFGSLVLKYGSRGEAVMELQRFLNAKLNAGLVVDGKLGPITISIIKDWQRDNGLASDGMVGPKTKAKMSAMFFQ